MRRLVCALALLAGCLDYEITVETVVQPDGTVRRVVVIRAGKKDAGQGDGNAGAKDKTWKRFVKPGKPYTLEKNRATALLKPGAYPSGLRHRLDDDSAEFAEGTVRIDVSDLGVGTLYSYGETIHLGLDPVRFRKELPKWLHIAVTIWVASLEREFKDLDFKPVEKHARETLVPEAVMLTLTLQAAFGAIIETGQLNEEQEKILVDAFAKLGVKRAQDAPLAPTLEEMFEDDQWDVGSAGIKRFLKPLRCSDEQRDRVIAFLMDDGGDMEEAIDALYPTEAAQAQVEADLKRFATAALGAYMTVGLFDDYEMRFRVRMPGEVLRTNGDLGALPNVDWLFRDDRLIITSPRMMAHSFVPAPWAPKTGWKVGPLLKLRAVMRDYNAEDRERIGERARVELQAGGEIEEDDEDKDSPALVQMWKAVQETKR